MPNLQSGDRAGRQRSPLAEEAWTMTRVRTDAEGAGCRRTLKKATELERKARAYRTGKRIAVGGGCKTAGQSISGTGYRSQWPRYATKGNAWVK